MPKIKYYYDTETCRYERVKVSSTDIILNLLGILTLVIISGLLFGFAFFKIFPSPEVTELRDQNDQLVFAFEELNDKVTTVEKWLRELEERDDNIYRSIFQADPIPSTIRQRGTGGSNQNSLEEYRKKAPDIMDLVSPLEQKVSKLNKRMLTQTYSYDKLIELARQKEQLLASIPAIQPVANKNLKKFASGFGYRWDPFTKIRRMHKGCDFSAPRGTPIFATGDGVVVKAGWGGGYGKTVDIDHGFGYMTRYAHMARYFVRNGQKVKRGEKIGEIGNTGRSTGPHLHYEVRIKGKPVNPQNYFFNDLSDEEYEEILKKSAEENTSMGGASDEDD